MAKADKNTAAETVAAEAGDESKRNAIAKKYAMRRADALKVADDEAVSTRVFGEAEVVRFDFATGERRVVDPADFSDEVQRCFLLYGIHQKLGDAYALNKAEVETAAAEGKSKQEAALDAFDAMLEMLQTGVWAQESKATGPRTGDVVAAWERAATTAGLSGDALDAKRATVAAGLKSGQHGIGDATPKAFREYVLGNPKVAQALAEIKAERAAERAKAAAEKAAGADAETSDDMLF